MKNLLFYTLVASLLIYMGCSNNSEDPGIDCNQSDLSVSITSTVEPTCETEGSISVSGAGGTSPYTFSLDGTNFQSSTEFTGLSAGNLTVTVKDVNGCTATLNSTLTTEGGISLSVNSTNSDCLNATGSITVTASGGDGTFTYSLNGGSGQAGNTFNAVGSGDQTVTVTDGTGCTASTFVYVNSDVSLEGDIMPLLQTNCVISGCHNGDNSCGSSCNWSVKNNVRSSASVIKERTGNKSMPQTGSLTDAEIAMIACWVDDGAKDN